MTFPSTRGASSNDAIIQDIQSFPETPNPGAASETRPGKQLPLVMRAALKKVLRYCEDGVARPYPSLDLRKQENPYTGCYLDSGLTLEFEVRMRQAIALQLRLEVDTWGLGLEKNWPTLTELRSRREDLTRERADLQQRLELSRSLLDANADLSLAAFQTLLATPPDEIDTTPLSRECRERLQAGGVRVPAASNPGDLYQAISIRVLQLESLLIELTVNHLRAELQIGRLRLYEAAGQFLVDQAKVIREEVDDEEAATPFHHFTYLRLSQCMEQPFDTRWPEPHGATHEGRENPELASHPEPGIRASASSGPVPGSQ